MVEADAESVESRLVAGQIACPGCGGELRPWGHARWRTLRDHGRPVRLRPRRSRCRSCLVTHVLLPVLALLRRLDLAAVIVEALVARHLEGRGRVEEERMEDKRQAVALFRYSLIRELADPELSGRQRGARIRALAATDHAFDGLRIEVSGPTLRRWLRGWRAGGFSGLVPGERRQPNRTPVEVLEAAEALKREAPRRTAAQVARALAEARSEEHTSELQSQSNLV